MTLLDDITPLIAKECDRQDELWGKQDHNDFIWLAILGEEVGEAANAVLDDRFGHDKGNLREELIQIAAVTVQWLMAIECRLEEL